MPFESFFGREVKGSVIMPGIMFLYSYFFLLQRTYPLAQLSLELGNTPSMLVVIGCSVLGNTLFSSSSCVGFRRSLRDRAGRQCASVRPCCLREHIREGLAAPLIYRGTSGSSSMWKILKRPSAVSAAPRILKPLVHCADSGVARR